MFSMKFEGKCKCFGPINLVSLRKLHRHATYQQIMVYRGDLNLLTINTQEITGLCHYVTSVRKTWLFRKRGVRKRKIKSEVNSPEYPDI